ncbi:uncharacterized [Tachysurus ichikawai]
MRESLEFGGATEASNDLFHRPSISWQLQHLSPSQKRATKMARATVSFRASPFHWPDPPRLCLEISIRMHSVTLRKRSVFREPRGPYQLPSALLATKKPFHV